MLKISFTGYLGADCHQKHINDQVAITFSVGVTKQWKNRQGVAMSNTTWVGCTIWRKPEHTRIAEFLKRGQQVYVDGEPSARAWIKNADGTAHCSLDCRVDNVELLGKAAGNNQPYTPAAQTNVTSEPNATAAPAITAANPADNDDLPF